MARKKGRGGHGHGIGGVQYKSNAGYHGSVGLGSGKLGGRGSRKGKRK